MKKEMKRNHQKIRLSTIFLRFIKKDHYSYLSCKKCFHRVKELYKNVYQCTNCKLFLSNHEFRPRYYVQAQVKWKNQLLQVILFFNDWHQLFQDSSVFPSKLTLNKLKQSLIEHQHILDTIEPFLMGKPLTIAFNSISVSSIEKSIDVLTNRLSEYQIIENHNTTPFQTNDDERSGIPRMEVIKVSDFKFININSYSKKNPGYSNSKQGSPLTPSKEEQFGTPLVDSLAKLSLSNRLTDELMVSPLFPSKAFSNDSYYSLNSFQSKLNENEKPSRESSKNTKNVIEYPCIKIISTDLFFSDH